MVVWLGVAQKTRSKRHMFKIDWTTCSRYNNHSRLKGEGIRLIRTFDEHKKNFTLVKNQIFIWAPNIMMRMTMTSNWICWKPSRTNCMFRILGEVGYIDYPISVGGLTMIAGDISEGDIEFLYAMKLMPPKDTWSILFILTLFTRNTTIATTLKVPTLFIFAYNFFYYSTNTLGHAINLLEMYGNWALMHVISITHQKVEPLTNVVDLAK